MKAAITMAALVLAAAPAGATELFAGLFVHDIDTFRHKGLGEGGADVQFGIRFAPVLRVGPVGGPAPYLLGSINSRGDTSFGAAGIAWRFGPGPFYVRPGIGVAVHTGPSYRVDARNIRTDLGSRVLFEPELGVGLRIAPRISVEANWTHMSHAQIFGPQNPGIDMIGARVNLHL